MSRENQNPAVVETGPPKLVLSKESAKRRLLTKAGAVAGAIALAASLSPLRPESALAGHRGTKVYHALKYVGVTSNQIWVPSLAEAQQAAQQIADTGANTVRFFEPYSPGQAEINNDQQRLCNAVEAAREKNLIPEISFIGHDHDKVNFVPTSASQVTKFLTTIGTILWNIAGPNSNKLGSNGPNAACVQQPLKLLMIEEGNEVNSTTFNSNADAPQKYAYLTVRAETAINADVAAINQAWETSSSTSTPLVVIKVIGGLAAGHNDPLGFQRQYDSAVKALGVNHFPGEIEAIHPYPADPTVDPATIEASLYLPMENELKTSFGKDISIFYDELGVGAVQATKRYLYGSDSLAAAAVSTGLQAQYYRDAIIEAASEPDVVGELTFQSQDAPNDGWPTGYFNADGTQKISTFNAIGLANHQAKTGNFGN